MAGVYSTPLLLEQVVSGALSSSVICPSGKVMVLRDVDAFTTGGSAVSLLSLRDSGTGLKIASFYIPTGSKPSQQWVGRQVFSAGSGFDFRADADLWNIMASGYLLDV